jgi:ribonuclease-3
VTHRLLDLADKLDGAVLQQVFTHTSWAAERADSYERLEFLGDSVLSLCITTELYRRFPDFAEGRLARLRAYVVSRATCARVATRLGLGKRLREYADQSREGGEVVQLETNQNVLADLTEALIGAVYLVFGFETVRPAVVDAFNEHIKYAVNSYVDYKTELQEHLARDGRTVKYEVLASKGPAHEREFEIEACIGEEALGHGVGTSKKRAEQEAAREALGALQAKQRRSARPARTRAGRAPAPEAS